MIEQEEFSIIERARNGEPEAFGLLYDRYQPQIYRFVYIKVGTREDAEDATHQTFLNAWKHIGNYRSMGFPFSSWLYQIARNEVIDYYRTRKPNISVGDEEEAIPDVHDLAHTTDDRIVWEQVGHAIRTLKPEYQDVVVMRFVEELSVHETAEAMGRSEGAIKLLQHRAIKALKKILDGKR